MADKDATFEVEQILAEAKGEELPPEEEEEDVKIYEPAPREKNTRILDFIPKKEEPKESAGELEGQMTFEGLEPEEEEPPVDKEQELEARLQDARREKVENFRLIQNDKAGFRLAGEEEQGEEESEPEDGTVLEDYNSYAETAAVRGELSYRRRSGRISLLVAGVLEFLLLCVMLVAGATAKASMEPIVFLTMNLALLIGLMLIGHRVIADGIGSILRLRAGADSITALAAFAAAIHTVLQYINLTEVANGQVTLYNAVAGLGLFLAMCGRQCRITRICRNFKLVSYKGDKYTALCVAGGKQQDQLARFLPGLSTPDIAYLKKCGFLTKFMENSYDDEGHEGLFCWFAPVMIVAAVLAAVAFVLLGGESANWWSAIGVFTALLCVSAPAFAVAGANLPLNRVGRGLIRRGAALIGWKAVERFREVNALVVDASDVFPSETVLLHGIKTFSGARIDEAILDAAAVSIEAGGPLAGVFRRVIENQMTMLQEVDTLLYEQEMGLSGWVGGRRVLVGNRRLLENHGVDVPSRDYEMRYTKDNRQLVYLSTGGELCAMFVVSYTADEGIADALNRLAAAGVTVLIRTCDPNVTQDLLHETFGVDEDAVRVLDTAAGRVREALVTGELERSEALLACNGRLEGFGVAVSLCRRLWARVRAAGVLQMVGAGLGFLLTALSVVSGNLLAPLAMVAHMLFWTLITGMVARVNWRK